VSPDATPLALDALCGIEEYVAGDLTLTARSGTTLAEIDQATAAHGQWCPLLPWGDDASSVGAVFATASGGPFAGSLGRPRDLAIGIEFVDGTGATIRGGGRVVKNVAGFDLTRLLVGSWGTLGVITEVSVRLRARPAVDETYAIAFNWDDDVANRRCDEIALGQLSPLAIARLLPSECEAIGVPAGHTLLARLGGNASFVAAARAALHALGELTPCDASAWTRYRAVHQGESPTGCAGAIGDPLSRRVRQQFDPRRVLNPGILGEDAA
jgi:glycolate oxidase FAD binding subunit